MVDAVDAVATMLMDVAACHQADVRPRERVGETPSAVGWHIAVIDRDLVAMILE
jgi:hypothetical protein